MPTIEAIKPKKQHVFQRQPITADASGNAPTQIEVVRAGSWPAESNKGMLYILPTDLQAMADNFANAVGCAGGLKELPIDFSHDDHEEAAGWITGLTVHGDVLIADVTWSDVGQEAIEGKRFKFFSPSFYPGCLGEWCDPEDWSITASNVLVGGALTNIPFFKNLQPVTASQNSQEGNGKNILFVDADAKGVSMPTLDEVRVKAPAELNEDEKTLLVEAHKEGKLSADEAVTFGFETAPVDATKDKEVEMTDEQKEAIQIQADIKAGKFKLVEASQFDAMQTTVTELKAQIDASNEEKIAAEVQTHVDRGAIKADRKDLWVARAKADAAILEDLEALQGNPVLASEIGGDATASGATTVADEVRAKAKDLVKASKDDGTVIDMPTAISKVIASDSDLAKRYDAEVKGA